MIAHKRLLGKRGEIWAKKYFEDKGYQILNTNWRYKHLEVDIISHKNDVLHFIEVKTRVGQNVIPEDSVDAKKIIHLIDAAEEYMIQHPIWQKLQIDVLSITVFENKKSFFLIEDIYI